MKILIEQWRKHLKEAQEYDFVLFLKDFVIEHNIEDESK